ncbi:MAG: type II toxin-antitoxin system RelE/ParE family toxin [Thermodesulfobacteriota bacterium]
MYKVRIVPRAQRDLDDLSGKLFDQVVEAIRELGDDPRPQGVIKLTGLEGYRVRVRDMRVLYRIDDDANEVIVYRVKHRREAYR